MSTTPEKTPVNGHMLVSGCADRENWNTQLLYFTCSSLSRDDKRIYLLSDRTGSPNVVVRDLTTGEEKVLTDNRAGTLKSYVYFDGESNYTYFKTREMPDVIVTVPRTQAETRRFGGEITVGGVAAQIDASISVIRASVRFTAVSEAFADIPADSDRWYEIELTDENGNVWTDEGWHWEDAQHMCFTMTGLGVLPEKLTARFRIVEEEKIIQETETPLTMQ